MKSPFLSIVIPVYKAEKTLARSLDSLINQEYRDIEIICVNDCSPDGSLGILREYAARDRRIVVVDHEKNMGSGGARKSGIARVTGEYITFLDPDDELRMDALGIIAGALTKKPSDILNFGIKQVNDTQGDPDYGREIERPFLPYETELHGEEIFTQCFVTERYPNNVCGKAFSKKLMDRVLPYVTDRRMSYAEDLYLYWMLADNAETFTSIKDKLYIYYFGTGISSLQDMTAARLKTYSSQGQAYQAIREYMAAAGKSGDIYETGLDGKFGPVVNTLVTALQNNLRPAQRQEAFRTLATDWPAYILAPAVARHSREKNHFSLDPQVMAALRPEKKEKITTVGMFYYRMNNGGIERVISLLSRILAKEGYRIVIFTEENPSPEDYPLPEGAVRVVLPGCPDFSDTKGTMSRCIAWDKAVKENNVDAVIYNAWVGAALQLDMMAVQGAGAKFVVYTHGIMASMYKIKPALAAIMPKLFSMCDGIIALSRTDEIYWGAFNSNVYLVTNPVDPQIMQVEPSPLDSLNILWMGRLSEQKLPLEMVEIMSLVHKKIPDARLTMVGKSEEGEFEGLLRKKIRRSGLENVITLTGYSDKPMELYANSSVYVLTSAYEGYPMTILESKAAGVPCVTYDMPYLKMFREDSEGMAIVPQMDRAEAAEEICRILTDESHRREMGREARESAEKLAKEDLAKLWNEIFSHICSHDAHIPEDKAEERLMIETQLQFIGIPREKKGILQRIVPENSEAARYVSRASQMIHDYGMKYFIIRVKNRFGVKFIAEKVREIFRRIFKR